MGRPKRPEFHPRLAEHRSRLGLTQEEVAERLRELARDHDGDELAATADTVARHERGRVFPGRSYRRQYARLYNAPETDLGLTLSSSGSDRVDDEMNRRELFNAMSAVAAVSFLPDVQELEEVTRRVQRMSASNVTDTTLDHLDLTIVGIGKQYETSNAAAIYPITLGQRRLVDELLRGQQRLRQRSKLYSIAGQLSAFLGYLAFDLGSEALAQAYCNEAFELARLVGNSDLAAWVRGTQSFIAYYTGDYRTALQLAEDGQRYAKNGPQSIRLAVNGEARALGRLGDAAGVDEAVSRATKIHDSLPELASIGYFLSFEPYSQARLAGNAASAYLSLGRSVDVRRYADIAISAAVAYNSPATHALSLLDISMSYLQGRNAKPDQACALADAALSIGVGQQSEVVRRRADAFVTAAACWRSMPEVAAAFEKLNDWQRRRPTSPS